jgi:hypothetical protein
VTSFGTVQVFQPAGEEPWNAGNDFSLWRCIVRELAEELRGQAEDYDTHRGPIDYVAWLFTDQLTRALDTKHVRAFCLGIGVDPLTFATDILTAVTIDAPLYDELFGQVADTSAEDRSPPPCPSLRKRWSGTRATSPPKLRAPAYYGSRGGTTRFCSLDHKYGSALHRGRHNRTFDKARDEWRIEQRRRPIHALAPSGGNR